MVSLGTPKPPSLQSSDTRFYKGAQLQQLEKDNVATTYSIPHIHAHPNKDTPTTS